MADPEETERASSPGAHPVAITGMHRSGTSMVTRGLHDAGLVLLGDDDALIEAADDNPEGFWENKAIVACNDDFLEATGGAWDHPPASPPRAADDPRIAPLVDAATAALDGLRVHDRWGFKDPRLCLTAAVWLDLEPDLRFVVCVRNPIEVALSLKRRNQSSYALGLALWERYYRTLLETVPVSRRIVSHYDSFFVDADRELARLAAFAGLEPGPSHVKPDLRHHATGVALTDADVSPTLRALYEQLCGEAGYVPPAEPPADEGRVRRLVLDGAAAQRHADQRQTAIERLEERLAESREREAEARRENAALTRHHEALDAKRQARIRELEAQLAAARGEVERTNQAFRTEIRELGESVAEAGSRTEERLARIERSTRVLDKGFGLARGGRVHRLAGRVRRGVPARVRRVGRAVVVRLPAPARDVVYRGRRLFARRGFAGGVRHAAGLARGRARSSASMAVVGRSRRGARAVAHRLPPPARQLAHRGRRAVERRGVVGAAGHATVVVSRRLPEPVHVRVVATAGRVRALRERARAAGVDDGARATTSPPPTARRPAKRTPLRAYAGGYRHLLEETVPQGSSWLVVAPGSPPETRGFRTPEGVPFGEDTDAGLTLVARVEAARVAGATRLVVPEGSRRWFRRHAQLRDHLTSCYRLLADRELAGIVFDLTVPPEGGSRSLLAEVSALTAEFPGSPAVLDWTAVDIQEELPGFTTFAPPPGSTLPYLDESVEVVVVDGLGDLDEAARVASGGVVVVDEGPAGAATVREVVTSVGSSGAVEPKVVVWSTDGDERWRDALRRRVDDAGAELHLPDGDGPLPSVDEHGVLVVVEPGVLPLPDAIEAAARRALTHPDQLIAGKVLRADGALEAVGATVFNDGSAAPIAGRSAAVDAPWHEYVRPVCWSPGLLAGTAEAWSAVDLAAPADSAQLREWCGEAWGSGRGVVYHPTVASVRVSGSPVADGGLDAGSSWERVQARRPTRPRELSDGAWRWLLANDDVEECRR